MSKRSRSTDRRLPSLERKVDQLNPIRKFVICCEGKNTEPHYLEALSKYYRVRLELRIIPAAGDPGRIVDRCIIERNKMLKTREVAKDSFEDGDRVWAVFDRDNFSRFEAAIRRCKSEKIGCAFSNPCFELWLLLHFCDFERAENAKGVLKELKRHCPSFSKRERANWSSYLVGSVRIACDRARRLAKCRVEEDREFNAPRTDMHLLASEMIGSAGLRPDPR